MQPLIEEILELARTEDEKVREEAIRLLVDLTHLEYESQSYERRIEVFFYIPERYKLMFLFDDEYGQISKFLSELFINDCAEYVKDIPFYLGSIYHADALEPLLEMMIEAPERFDEEWIGTQLILALNKLIERCEIVNRKKFKKIIKAKSPVPFFKRWSISSDPDTAEAGLSWLEGLKEKYGIVK